MIDAFADLELTIHKIFDYIVNDLTSLRTGKASPALLDPGVIEAYGTKLKLTEVASVSAPDPTLLIVTPWDKHILEAVAKGVAVAELNLNPVIDGDLIRIVVPPLTTQRRQELVKILHQKLESGRVMIRAARAKAKKDIERQKNQQDVSEDDITNSLRELDDQIKTILEKLEDLGRKKEVDLLTI